MFVSSCVGEGVIVLDRRVGMRELLIIVDSGNNVTEDWCRSSGGSMSLTSPTEVLNDAISNLSFQEQNIVGV